MKITIETYSEKGFKENDYQGKFLLKIDGERFISFLMVNQKIQI